MAHVNIKITNKQTMTSELYIVVFLKQYNIVYYNQLKH